jgi:hypothetical protein
VFLAILISVARQHIRSDFYDWGLLSTLYKLDIQKTLLELQNDFCRLWNECREVALTQPPDSFPVGVLRLTRILYITLHHNTPAAPTRFSAATPDFDAILFQPSFYPLCNISDHLDPTTFDPDAVPLSAQPGDSPIAPLHQPTHGNGGTQRLAEELDVIRGTPLHDTITRGMQESSLASPAISPTTSPVHTNPSTAPMSSPAPAFTTLILNQPLMFYGGGPASTSSPPPPGSPTITTSPV